MPTSSPSRILIPVALSDTPQTEAWFLFDLASGLNGSAYLLSVVDPESLSEREQVMGPVTDTMIRHSGDPVMVTAYLLREHTQRSSCLRSAVRELAEGRLSVELHNHTTGKSVAISIDTQSRIIDLTNEHWAEHVRDESFAELIIGKEPGHRMADYVDDRTCALLKINLDTRYEGNRKGAIRKRSMGDILIRSQGIYNPINVKSGLQAMKGQPNVVSMQKLLDYVLKRWIDSYYLLIIKFDLSTNITHKSYLIDLLDWTEFITYDAGPGQIMLREQELYDKLDTGYAPQYRTIFEKVDSLFRLFERQLQALFSNRQQRLARQRTLAQSFQQAKFVVDQSQLEFVP